MSVATKFSFDTTFDTADPKARRAAEEEAPPPEPTFCAEELAAARAEGFAEGHQAGLAEANSSLEQAAAQALSEIAAQLGALGPSCQAGLDRSRHDAIEIARAVTRRTVEQSARDMALETVEVVLGEMLPRVIEEPRVVIRVHNELLDPLQTRLYSVTEKCGFPGAVILLAEPDLQLPDCRIEWADGGAEYNSDAVLSEIDGMIERYRAGIGTCPQEPEDVPQATEIEEIEEQANG